MRKHKNPFNYFADKRQAAQKQKIQQLKKMSKSVKIVFFAMDFRTWNFVLHINNF